MGLAVSIQGLSDNSVYQTRTFEYNMLVPPSMEAVGIFRRKVEGNTGTNAEDFEVHPFPYKTLPIIKSHLLPHYVIYNAGKKMSAMQQDPEVYKNFLKTNTHIEQLSERALKTTNLFHRWVQARELPLDWLENGPLSTRSPPTHSSQAPTEARRQLKRAATGGGSPTMSKRAKKEGGQGKQQQQAQEQQAQDDLDGSTLLNTQSIKKLDRRSDRQIHNEIRASINKWRASVVKGVEVETPNEARQGDVESMC